jgi:hypothetical protein
MCTSRLPKTGVIRGLLSEDWLLIRLFKRKNPMRGGILLMLLLTNVENKLHYLRKVQVDFHLETILDHHRLQHPPQTWHLHNNKPPEDHLKNGHNPNHNCCQVKHQPQSVSNLMKYDPLHHLDEYPSHLQIQFQQLTKSVAEVKQ